MPFLERVWQRSHWFFSPRLLAEEKQWQYMKEQAVLHWGPRSPWAIRRIVCGFVPASNISTQMFTRPSKTEVELLTSKVPPWGSTRLSSRTTWKNCLWVTAVLCSKKKKKGFCLCPAYMFSNISNLGEDFIMPAWISYTITTCGGCGNLITSLWESK